MLTVNIPEAELKDDEFLIKTWSENADLADVALESGLFVDTGKAYSGCPIWKLAPGVKLDG